MRFYKLVEKKKIKFVILIHLNIKKSSWFVCFSYISTSGSRPDVSEPLRVPSSRACTRTDFNEHTGDGTYLKIELALAPKRRDNTWDMDSSEKQTNNLLTRESFDKFMSVVKYYKPYPYPPVRAVCIICMVKI